MRDSLRGVSIGKILLIPVFPLGCVFIGVARKLSHTPFYCLVLNIIVLTTIELLFSSEPLQRTVTRTRYSLLGGRPGAVVR